MNQQTKLLLALQQIENLNALIEDNEYQKYLHLHLTIIQVELQRQLTNFKHSSTMKESFTKSNEIVIHS